MITAHCDRNNHHINFNKKTEAKTEKDIIIEMKNNQ